MKKNVSDEEQQNRKRAIQTSLKGIVYLVLVMIGIFGITSLMKMTGFTSAELEKESKEQKAEWEESRRVKEANGKLALKSEVTKNKKDGIADLPLRMYLKVLEYKDGILRIEVNNQSGYMMEYQKVWKIAYEENGDWRELGTIFDQSDVEKGQSEIAVEDVKKELLMDLIKVILECDLNTLGELKAGTYRILMGDLETEFTLEEVEE